MKKTLLWLVLMSSSICGSTPPNVVLIFLDDSGWSDFHPFGNPSYATPNVERLASQGARFNKFFVPQAICSASRASLMTGAYPGRTKVFGAHGPLERGLDPKFATMGEVFQRHGYKTALFGKWHLGDQPDTRPAARGFDESEGLMYSNDMWEYHPTDPETWGKHPLQYWRDGEVMIERVTPEFQKSLTTRAIKRAVDFIGRHQAEPFFLYVPHSMPHVPLFVSDKFAGRSGAGLYGDVIMELDWSVGQIMQALADHGLEENTIVIFTSDNGPWAVYGNHAGRTPFREAKATGFNGGTQSAMLIKYPGRIEAGASSDVTFCSVDLLPTLCRLTGASLPANEIDGRDIWPLLKGDSGATNPHAYYPVSTGSRLEAVISGDGRWKLHLPHGYRQVAELGRDGASGTHIQKRIGLALFDLDNDPGESTDVIETNLEVAHHLLGLALQHRAKFYE